MLARSRPIRKCVKPIPVKPKKNKKKKKNKHVEEHNKSLRCKFQIIPIQTKYQYKHNIEYLYGDIPVMKLGSQIVSDLSFLNKLKIYQDLHTIEICNKKALSITMEDKTSQGVSDWLQLIEEFKFSGSPELIQWADSIQIFSQKYKRILCLPRKKAKSEGRRGYFQHVIEATEQKKKELFESHPFIQLKYRHRNHKNQLTEMIFSESVIKDLGYSTEDFSFLVLEEGLPQIFSYEAFPNDCGIRELLDRYFTLGVKYYETPEFDSLLCMKQDYVRPISFKGYYFMNYENNAFGIDAVIVIEKKGEPYLSSIQGESLNVNFVTSMINKERDSEHFFSSFYNFSCGHQYANIHKICKIKEIS